MFKSFSYLFSSCLEAKLFLACAEHKMAGPIRALANICQNICAGYGSPGGLNYSVVFHLRFLVARTQVLRVTLARVSFFVCNF